MKYVTSLALVAVLFSSPFVVAQEPKGKEAKEAQGGGMPGPGPAQKALKMAEGTWNALIEMPGLEASKGVSVQKMVLGGMWLEDSFKADLGGMPFEGRGMTGFDQIKGKYVGTWCDSMSPGVTVTEGTYDEKTRTLTMVGDTYDHTGAKVKARMLTIHKDANTVVFEMYYVDAAGKEAKQMTITYTRAGGTPAK